MQLKSLAKTKEALNSITSVLNTTYKTRKECEEALAVVGRSYTTETLKAAIAQSTLEKEQIKVILSANGLQKELIETTADELANAASTNMAAKEQLKATGTTSGLSLAFKGLWFWIKDTTIALLKFLFLTPKGWATLTASAIGLATMAVINYNKKIEENKKKIREAAEEAKSAIDSLKSDFNTLVSDTNKIKKRYAELAQGVENLGKANQSRGSLSTEDYEEFLDLSNQLAKLFPQLTINFDNNGNSILNLSGSVDTIVGSLENLVSVQQKLTNMQILEKMPEVWSGYMLDHQDYRNDQSDARHNLREALKAASDIEEDGRSISIDIFKNDPSGFEEAFYSAITKTLQELGYDDDQIVKMSKISPYYTSYLGGLIKSIDGHNIEWDFSSFTEEEFKQFKHELKNQLGKLSQEYEKAVMLAESKIDSGNFNLVSHINTWLSEEGVYGSLNPDMQNIVKSMLLSCDWVNLMPHSVDKTDWDDVSKWLQERFLDEIYKVQDDKEISKALSEIFFNTELKPKAKADYIKQVQKCFGKRNVVSILLQPMLDETKILPVQFSKITKWSKSVKETVSKCIVSVLNKELFTQLTNSADSLDKFQSSIKSAADAYTTLLTGNYSSSELLDSIQAINKAASDMGESIDWESIAASDNPLQAIQEQIEAVSNTYTKSILSGTGIDTDSKFGQMLANIVQEAYKSEAALSSLNTQIDSLQSAYNDLTDIITAYNETGYITFDQLQALLAMEPQYLSCLIDENGQLQLNQQSMIALANQRLDDAEAQAIQQAITELGELTYRNEQAAIKDVDTALIDNAETLTTYEEKLLETAGITNLTTNEFIQLSNAINGAMNEGASQEQVDDVIDNMNKKLQLIGNIRNRVNTGDFASAFGSAGKNAAKSFTDALDKELTALDKKMEAGYKDFNDYIQARLALIEAYYKQGKLSADEYYSYLEKHYDTQLSYMDKVVSAVTRRIDTEIDALKQQKEDVESLYAVQIESLEKQKTLLEEANQERQRQIDLQKTLYDLERAKNQRTKLVYSEDKGMHYVADDQSIRDAQKSADDAKYENQIAEIEKSISKLEEARDQETNVLDEMISSLEDYKNAWSDITSAYQEDQEDLLAAQFFGAEWESKILSNRLDVLKDFKEQYIRIQQEIAAAAARESANEQTKVVEKTLKEETDTPKTDTSSKAPKKKEHILDLPLFHAYGSGTNNAKKGLNLVGEDGAEAYFDNHGHVAIVTKPTLIPMEGGEVVKNEHDTKELLDPDNLTSADTIGLADIDGKEARYTLKVDVEAETFTLSDGTVLTPLQPGNPIWDMQQKLNSYINGMGSDISSVTAPISTIQRDMECMANSLSTVNNICNNGKHSVTIGDIHVTCPGVTSQEVAKQVGVELNRQFRGLSLVALQESKK